MRKIRLWAWCVGGFWEGVLSLAVLIVATGVSRLLSSEMLFHLLILLATLPIFGFVGFKIADTAKQSGVYNALMYFFVGLLVHVIRLGLLSERLARMLPRSNPFWTILIFSVQLLGLYIGATMGEKGRRFSL